MTLDLYGRAVGAVAGSPAIDTTVLQLYALLPDARWLAARERAQLYGTLWADHADCWLSTFCRNPLHPGPCKGWKKMLHGVSPGAWHALERRRVDEANKRRQARVAALKAAGKKVPPRLAKPIPYPDANAKPGGNDPVAWKPPTDAQAKAALPRTSKQIGDAIAKRRAAQAPPPPIPAPLAPAGGKDQHALDAAQVLANSAAALGVSLRDSTTQGLVKHVRDALDNLPAGKKLSEDPKIAVTIDGLVKRAANAAAQKGKPLSVADQNAMRGNIAQHVDSGVPDTPLLVESTVNHAGIKSVPAPKLSKPASGTPSAAPSASPGAPKVPSAPGSTKVVAPPAPPVPATPKKTIGVPGAPSSAPPQVQHAVAVANRTAPGAGVAKKQVAAYDQLTKDDFDALPQTTKDQINTDLTAAHAKFLDPKKRADVQRITDKLNGKDTKKTTPPPAAGSTPKPASAPPAPGYDLAQKRAVDKATVDAAATTDDSFLSSVRDLTKPSFDALRPADQKAILDRLSGIGGLALHKDRGTALLMASRLTGKPLPASRPGHVQDALDRINGAVKSGGAPDSTVYGGVSKASYEKDFTPAQRKRVLDRLVAIRGNLKPGDPDEGGVESAIKAIEEIDGIQAPSSLPGLDAAKKKTNLLSIAQDLTALGRRAQTPRQKAELEEHRATIETDASKPNWLRTLAHIEGKPSSKVTPAERAAADLPGNTGTWYPTTHKMDELYDIDDADLAALPPYVRDAIAERRSEGVRNLLNAGSHQSTLHHVFGDALDDRTRYEGLSADARRAVDSALRATRDSRPSPVARSQWQKAIDLADGVSYNSSQRDAIDAIHDPGLIFSPAKAVNRFDKLDPGDYQGLAQPHREAISDQLRAIGRNHVDPVTRRDARHLQAELSGRAPSYADPFANKAAWVAGIDRDDTDPDDRATAYKRLGASAYGAMSPGDKMAVQLDMDNLANGTPGAGLTLDTRFEIQDNLDNITNVRRPFHIEAAIGASDRVRGISEAGRLSAYQGLSPAEYKALPKAYRDAIDEDLTDISKFNPAGWSRVMQHLHPGWAPPHAPAPVTTTAPSSMTAKDALDVIYGIDPKAKTAARQLKVYGTLRVADFATLQPHEQSTLLGDLSYIETTSKGPNKARAAQLINYFTPPGTPAGHIPAQPINVPASAVAGQRRSTDPLGDPGLMKLATNKGANGDGWSRNPNGSTGPWGKYGAAGVMLSHVGPDGKRRFLMVERGPGISDPGKWQFPGGAIDSLESPHEGATRETVEELGFKNNDLDGARVHGEHVYSIPGGWKYTSIAATVPTQLVPDLSTHHARMETSDAKWMTEDEIDALDSKGKLLAPLAGGKLKQNVMSLFPATTPSQAVARPAPRATRPARLTGTPSVPVPPPPHKPSRGKDLLATTAAKDALRQQVKHDRKNYAGKTADDRLAAISAMQGFDDTPTVKTKAEIDALLKTGDYIEVFRGVRSGGGKSAAKINEEMRNGPAYYGRGVFGNGYYLATQRSVANQYADGTKNSIARILIPKAAVIKDHGQMVKEAHANSAPRSKAKGGTYENGTLYDEGRYAAAKGVDGIEIKHTAGVATGLSARHVAAPGQPAYTWLNRSVLIIQEAE